MVKPIIFLHVEDFLLTFKHLDWVRAKEKLVFEKLWQRISNVNRFDMSDFNRSVFCYLRKDAQSFINSLTALGYDVKLVARPGNTNCFYFPEKMIQKIGVSGYKEWVEIQKMDIVNEKLSCDVPVGPWALVLSHSVTNFALSQMLLHLSSDKRLEESGVFNRMGEHTKAYKNALKRHLVAAQSFYIKTNELFVFTRPLAWYVGAIKRKINKQF